MAGILMVANIVLPPEGPLAESLFLLDGARNQDQKRTEPSLEQKHASNRPGRACEGLPVSPPAALAGSWKKKKNWGHGR